MTRVFIAAILGSLCLKELIVIYPDYMTLEDIAEFELDMARFDLDPSMEFDEINRILREIYFDQLAAQSELLQFYNI